MPPKDTDTPIADWAPDSVQFKRGEWEGQAMIFLEFEETNVGKVTLAFQPDGFVSMMMAGLAGLGFTEEDLVYIAERYEKTFS